MPPADRRAEWVVAVCLGTTLVAGVGLLALYLAGGQTQLEGLLLFLALGGLGAGLVVWSHLLLPVVERTEERPSLASLQADREAVADAVAGPSVLGRRPFLARMLAAASAGLVAAFALPLLSLGPAPGRSLFETPWRRGLRLVDGAGHPVRAADLPTGSATTVFPEGVPGSADGQTILVRVEPGLLQLTGDAADWAPDGFVAYSKLCTHAGCPVGLFSASTNELICPCHQSTFDVLRGAVPTYGPAVRPLPQLPIRLAEDGTFVALGDFPEPVGPSFWDMRA